MNIIPSRSPAHFDFLLPPDQQWFTPKEVARLIGRTDQYVRDAFENQKILGHQGNARARRGREKRRTYQVHREGVILFLLETANYGPDDFVGRVQELLRHRTHQQLTQVQKFVTGRLAATR